ncbi:hypothetical protein BBP40_006494 [Aspergillus hancockii]|nr:hypothetical protein BBP40_006494 [Aspergillus hancockii]
MSFVKLIHFAGLLTLAAGKPILLPRQASGAPQDGARNLIDVQLQSLGNSTVKAFITNIADEDLRVVKRGGLLDNELPTKKVVVTGTGANPTFTGAEVDYVNTHLTPEAFMDLAPNQTIESTFDIADSHDLTPGKAYSAIADGMLEYTKSADPKKFFFVPYKSNAINFDAPENAAARLAARATLASCTEEYNKLMQSNLVRAADMAKAGAADARNGSTGLFEKFFKSQNQADKKEVAERLEAIAKEATSKGVLTYYCQASAQDSCGGNIAAITYPSQNRVVNCQGYYETEQVVNQCGYLDQAAISLHEFAHATAVYAPGTDDVAYGLDNVLQLNTQQAKNNADSFAYYANAAFNKCSTDGSQTGPQSGTQTGSQTVPQTGTQSTPQTGGQVGGQNGGEITTIPWEQIFGQGSEEEVTQGNGQQNGQGTSSGADGWIPVGSTTESATQSGSGWPAGFSNFPWPFGRQGTQTNGGQSDNNWPSSSGPSSDNPGTSVGIPFGTPATAPWGSKIAGLG